MTFISITRLRVRSIRFLPAFALYTLRALRQVKSAPGFAGGALLPDRRRAFWTLTAWDSEQSMRAFMLSGAHKSVMPKLLNWCDEASVVHWSQPHSALPTWTEADQRMRADGRASKVRHPSPNHASLNYPAPNTTRSAPIKPAKS